MYKIDKVFDKKNSKSYDLNENKFFFLIHAGSGDVGIFLHHESLKYKDLKLNMSSNLGKKLLNFNQIAGNFGFANRLFIFKQISDVLRKVLKNKIDDIDIFSDLPHDYLDYIKKKNIFLHRKGAVRFISRKSIKNKKDVPYLFPSCPGGDGYIFIKTNNKKNYDCVSHGAGRIISKKNSLIYFKNTDFTQKLINKTTFYRYNKDKIHAHHPNAFKNLKIIISTIKKYSLAKPIAKCKMIASLKA